MQIGICIQDPTTASGGSPPELVALQEILAQLNQINGNTDLVESLQAASNSALTNLASYVDGLETMISSLNSNTDGLEAMMANLGINTDEIESKLSALVAKPSGGVVVLQGWVLPFASTIKVPAYIWIKPHASNPALDVATIYYAESGVWTTLGSPSPLDSLGVFGVSWGLGDIPLAPVVNTPGSFGVTGIALTSMPVASVKSVTLLVTNNAMEYSTDAGVSWVTIAAGTRTWTAQAGASLNVANLRFRGTIATAMYDIIYEV